MSGRAPRGPVWPTHRVKVHRRTWLRTFWTEPDQRPWWERNAWATRPAKGGERS